MDLVVSAVLPLFALILSGSVSAWLGVLGPSATDSLNRFVIWLALPALLFQVMAQIHPADLARWDFVAAFGGGMVATAAVSFALDRRAGKRLADLSIEGLDAAYANVGFLGIPLGLAVFGAAAVPVAVVAVLLTVCVLFALSIVLIEIDLHPGAGRRAVAGKVGLSLARNPLLVAPVAGAIFAATGLPLPGAVLRFTTLLGGAASPCALVTIGLFMAQRHAGARAPTVARLVALKLVVQPMVTAGLAFGIFRMPPLWSHFAVLLSALPTGTGPFMLAKFYEREAAVTAQAILISTLFSLVTLAVLVSLLGRL